MELREHNYFSEEANREYFSVSQFKSFMKCEAATMAELNGEHERELTDALLVGSYVDAWFEGTLEQFKTEHPQCFKKDGALKSQFVKAEEIIERVQEDAMFMAYMSGKKQVIKTGELFGYPWKIKIDSLSDEVITDLKVIRDFEDVYVPGDGKVGWVEAWGYDIQGAVYQAIEGNDKPFVLAAVTKEKVPDIGLFMVPQYQLNTALKIVEHNIDHFAEVKAGFVPAKRCEKCDYCKRTKKLASLINYGEDE